jgi:hypothetical protein
VGVESRLQGLADECGLIITVMHYPTGASKWNLIEHRMFSLISGNWAGEPLVSYEVMLQFIRRTRSATGFHCQTRLDTTPDATGQKVSKEERRAVRLKRRPVLPRWNYTIFPRPVSVHGPRVTKSSDTKAGAVLRGNESAGGYRGRCARRRLAGLRYAHRCGGPAARCGHRHACGC